MKFNLRDQSLWGIVISIVAIAIIALAYFYPDDMQGNVLQQHDIKQGMAIGQEAKAFQEITGETTRWTNSLFSGMPTFQISPTYPSNSLFGWLNTVMGLGLPAPANLLAMMMLGFFILCLTMRMRWYVALLGAIAYGFSSYFIIIIGAGHIWKFVTLAYVPPTIAGIVLTYRKKYLLGAAVTGLFTMLQISANHPQMTYYFLFVILGFAVAYLIKAIRNHEIVSWGKATGILVIAGLLGVTANSPSLYNTYEYSKLTIRGNHSELSPLEPVAQDNVSSGLDRDYITMYSYGRSETFSLLIPNVKGGASVKPEKGSIKLLQLASLPETKDMADKGQISPATFQYLQYASQYFGDPQGTNGPVYVGALIFALFLLGCVIVKGPIKWVLIILTIFSILLALGRHFMVLTDLMIDYMPMYARFRTVESILVIAEFCIPLLAVMALNQIISEKDAEKARKLYRGPFFWSFGIVLLFCLAAIVFPSVYGEVITEQDRQVSTSIANELQAQGYDAQSVMQVTLHNPVIKEAVTTLRHSLISSDGLRSFVITALGGILIFLYFRRNISTGVAVLGIGFIVLIDLYSVNKRYLDHESFMSRQLTTGTPFTMTNADQAILADTVSHYRVMDIPRFNDADPSYFHKTLGGYHAAKLTRYQDLIDRHLYNFLAGTPTEADFNVINMLNARYVIDGQNRPLLNDEAFGNAWFVDSVAYVRGADNEMEGLSLYNPRYVAVADEAFRQTLGEIQPSITPDSLRTDNIRLTSYSPNRLTYHSSNSSDGVAVFSEVYFPWGWYATIDGQEAEIGRVDYVLRAMKVPAGEHTIEMWFDPQSLRVTNTLATVSIAVIYFMLLLAAGTAYMAVRKRKDEKETENKK